MGSRFRVQWPNIAGEVSSIDCGGGGGAGAV